MTGTSFRERLRARQRLVGTFVKTPAYQVVEVIAQSGIDFVVIDAEHAPFDRAAIDACVMIARAMQLPSLIRLPDIADATVLNALDVGATGIVMPHAKDEPTIRSVHGASRYLDGRRGFSNSPRAGSYGRRGLSDLVESADRDGVVVCQVEDREAVENIEKLVRIDEVDCWFIGRADLAVSYGVLQVDHPVISDAVAQVCAACTVTGKAVGIFLPDVNDIEYFAKLGVTMFVIGSDQSLLRTQVDLLARISTPVGVR
jgi:2-keto-3-deoxy-L-rhamnonate aldolase RhmA